MHELSLHIKCNNINANLAWMTGQDQTDQAFETSVGNSLELKDNGV